MWQLVEHTVNAWLLCLCRDRKLALVSAGAPKEPRPKVFIGPRQGRGRRMMRAERLVGQVGPRQVGSGQKDPTHGRRSERGKDVVSPLGRSTAPLIRTNRLGGFDPNRGGWFHVVSVGRNHERNQRPRPPRCHPHGFGGGSWSGAPFLFLLGC